MEKQIVVKQICPSVTQEWVNKGILLVDVREKNEVEQLAYDVPNIINIPLSEFEERYTELPKNIEMVMVCKSGGRSLRATAFLVNHGYTNVVNMEHGIIRWVQKGFPTIGDTSIVVSSGMSNSCCTPSSEKKKTNMSDLGDSCDCSKPGCC